MVIEIKVASFYFMKIMDLFFVSQLKWVKLFSWIEQINYVIIKLTNLLINQKYEGYSN